MSSLNRKPTESTSRAAQVAPTADVSEAPSADADEIWRSLAELEDKPAFVARLQAAAPVAADGLADPVGRRRFMQLMGASMAFAGLTGAGCQRWEEDNVVPLGRRPEGYVPGQAKYFATAMALGGVAQPLIAKSSDGRPIKVEGNPDHPASSGASSLFAQASILGLYDPDRSTGVVGQPSGSSWADFEKFVKEQIVADGGGGLRVLSQAIGSPTLARLKDELIARYPQAKWHQYEPITRDNEREGARLAFGAPFRPVYHLDRAEVVLSVDSDLFSAHPDALQNARGFAKTRRPDGPKMSRLWVAESVFSTTGAMADHRLPVRGEQLVAVLMAVDAALDGRDIAGISELFADEAAARFVRVAADDLKSARGASLVAVGYRQPPEAHALAAKINAKLGAAGRTVGYVADTDSQRPHHRDDMASLAKAMAAGQVKTLVILGGNPVYDAPADLAFGDLLSKVDTSVHLSLYPDETSAACTWHLPEAHYLETWGDGRTWNGMVTLQQPLVKPLYGGRSAIEVANLIATGKHTTGHDLVQQSAGADDPLVSKMWQKAVHDGYVPRTALAEVQPAVQAIDVSLSPRAKAGRRLGAGDLEVVFTHSPQVWDGRFANNAWLQEVPQFLTKSVWDNYAMVSPETAHAVGVTNDTLAVLEVGGKSLELPVYVMPGQAPYSVAVHLGYGRSRAGVVGGHGDRKVESIGANTYELRTAASLYAAGGAKLKATGKKYVIGNVQDHWDIKSDLKKDLGRESIEERLPSLIKEASVSEFEKHPEFAKKMPGPISQQLWDEHDYSGTYRWGMATDLGACTGCNSCVVACQAENNIPVVGKKEVLNSREMHWLRIDRYFKGDKENPEVAHQPLTCQQCENAPCEQVCPVGATIHSSEGLNDMVYNRCVGTRYCLNNCPYKVRRFNFFNWHDGRNALIDTEGARNKVRKLLFNPDVTVRSRGVMEKCTFCVQRIQGAKIEAHNKRQKVQDGEIQTACQQACPTGAIVFGDLNDKESRVAKLHADKRSYPLLGEYLTLPRNAYLARIRNPHPDMPAAHKESGGHH